jgi:hypothetical protein
VHRRSSLLGFLDESSRWAKLRLFGNSHIAQATIAVPILGYFLLFNQYLLEYLRLHSSFCAAPACSPSWRLQLLYFGCFFMALGAAIYAIRCPTVVKIYSGASNFFEAEKMYFSAPRNLAYLFGLIERDGGKPAADPFNLQSLIANHAALNQAHLSALADVMANYYVLQNTSRRISRIAVLLAYSLGVFLLLIPTVVTFFQILFQATRTLIP